MKVVKIVLLITVFALSHSLCAMQNRQALSDVKKQLVIQQITLQGKE